MARPAIKPTVLFIHGAWHTPKHFGPIRTLLQAKGYPTECPLLPTSSAKPEGPPDSLPSNVMVIQGLLTKLVDEECKEVIVAMHSYGGLVGTQAVLARWGKKARSEQLLPGGVVRLFYMCSFVLPQGASLTTPLGEEVAPFVTVLDNGLSTVSNPGSIFYNDLSSTDKDRWAAELVLFPIITMKEPVTHVAYKHHPVTYLYCEQDQAIPLEIQQKMVKDVGADFMTETCNSGHSPFLSQPETVLRIVEDIFNGGVQY